MSRSFAKPAFSRTATSNTKQSTTSTQNTFTFQNYLSYFGRWLEKSNELRSNWRSAPPPTAPPSSLSSTYWLVPFSLDVKKGKDTSMLGNRDEDVEEDDQGWLLGWIIFLYHLKWEMKSCLRVKYLPVLWSWAHLVRWIWKSFPLLTIKRAIKNSKSLLGDPVCNSFVIGAPISLGLFPFLGYFKSKTAFHSTTPNPSTGARIYNRL